MIGHKAGETNSFLEFIQDRGGGKGGKGGDSELQQTVGIEVLAQQEEKKQSVHSMVVRGGL